MNKTIKLLYYAILKDKFMIDKWISAVKWCGLGEVYNISFIEKYINKEIK